VLAGVTGAQLVDVPFDCHPAVKSGVLAGVTYAQLADVPIDCLVQTTVTLVRKLNACCKVCRRIISTGGTTSERYTCFVGTAWITHCLIWYMIGCFFPVSNFQ